MVTTTITIFEIEYGIARLPEGNRRQELEKRFAALTGEHVDFTVLPFEEKAARLAGKFKAYRETGVLHSHVADMMIAAICALAGASLATRNTKDFTNTGIELINPWDFAS